MASSRFAHYIKVIMRDKVGSFQTRQSVETYLNTWISDYVCLNDSAPQGRKRVYHSEMLGSMFLKFLANQVLQSGSFYGHFQMEELTASIRLVVIPSSRLECIIKA